MLSRELEQVNAVIAEVGTMGHFSDLPTNQAIGEPERQDK